MEMSNTICIVGNHELMAIECLKFLSQEITDQSLDSLDPEMLDNLVTWQYNGSKTTIEEFRALSPERRQDVIDFLGEFVIYEEVTVGDRDFLLVHAGLGNYSLEKEIEDYNLYELVWERADYSIKYFEDKYVVTGHTPTHIIEENPRPGYIFKSNNHIAIDCGAHYSDGRLAAICLDTMEEFYEE
jgi:serine/threonine protein phosphatase 1